MGALTLSLRTEKVAGSSPAERTPEIPRFAVETWSGEKGLEITSALLTEI
jgi:hypothetical protein